MNKPMISPSGISYEEEMIR